MVTIPSNFSLSYSLLRSMEALQDELRYRQKEISTGRKSDIVENLGNQLRRSVNSHSIYNKISAYIINNSKILSKLEVMQSSLANIAQNADDFKSSLILTQNDGRGQNLISGQAANALNLFISSLNSSFDNQYIFSGEKTNIKAVNSFYTNTTSAIKSKIDEAFSKSPPAGFGFPQTSPLVSSISSEELRVFINGPLSEFFSEDVWSTNWSNASSQSTKNIISPSQQLETSITANEPALRKVAMAYVMMCNLGAENMNAETYQTLAKSAGEILNEGFKLLNSSRTRIGVIQQTVKASNEALRKQSNMLEIQIGNLESVDQAEVATRTNNLLSRIEASLALTSRIASLTLVRYL